MAPTRFHKFLPFLMTTVAAGLAAALVILIFRPDILNNAPKQTIVTHAETDPSLSRQSGPVSYAEAVEKTSATVVNVYAAKITTDRLALSFKDPVLQYFFGDKLPERTRKRLKTSLGSGVIVSSDGYILTNYHVIKAADEIKVVLDSGKEFNVTLVGTDPETDLAVLKINDSKLPAITLGNSSNLKVGDVVLAIGNPFGVGQTVTMGIISATGRSDLGISTYENFIQTDASINPGNSGGALINAHGELIGINTAIFSKSGGSQGIGFAIPVNLATGVMEQLIEKGHVVRGWLGVSGQKVTAELAESFGLREVIGVLVSRTLEDGPAEQAGIRPGDVITHINDVATNDIHEVLDLISNAGPNTKLEIVAWRGKNKIHLIAITGKRPALRQR